MSRNLFFYEETKTKNKKKKRRGDEGKITFGKRNNIEFSCKRPPSQREGQQQNLAEQPATGSQEGGGGGGSGGHGAEGAVQAVSVHLRDDKI